MTTQPQRYFRLANENGPGVACDASGLAIGRVALLENDGSGASRRPKPLAEINNALSRSYGLPVDFAVKVSALTSVAKALNAGEIAYAQLVALSLQMPDPPSLLKATDGRLGDRLFLAQQLEALGLLRKDWDPAQHPRWPAGSSDSVGGEFAPAGELGGDGAPQGSARREVGAVPPAHEGQHGAPPPAAERPVDQRGPPGSPGAVNANSFSIDAASETANPATATQQGGAGVDTAASNPTPSILRVSGTWTSLSNLHDIPEIPDESSGARIVYQAVNSDGWQLNGSLHTYTVYETILSQQLEGPSPPPGGYRANKGPVVLSKAGTFVDYVTFPSDQDFTFTSTTIQTFSISVDGGPPVPVGPTMKQTITVLHGQTRQVHLVEMPQ